VAVSRRDVGIQVPDVGFVDAAMAEAAIIRSFVNDHSIFHVVASIADDSDDGVNSTRTHVEIVLKML